MSSGGVDVIDDVEQLIHVLADDAGRRPPMVCWTSGGVGKARSRGGRDVVEIGRDLLRNPAAARMIAAHEMGHVTLRHTTRRATATALAVIIGPMVVFLAAAVAAGFRWAGLPNGVGFAVVGAVVWVAVAPMLIRPHHWRYEHAADVYAAQNGAVLTAELAAWFEGHGTRGGGWIDMHPSWAARASHVASHLCTEPQLAARRQL